MRRRPAGRLTVAQGTALYIGAVLGTGVIALPALAAEAAGPASLIAWLGLVILSIPLAGTFAALGARYPDAGGVSTYVRYAFGARAAAVVGWCFYFAVPAGAPAAAMFGGAYVAAALGGGTTHGCVTAAALMVVVTLTNAFGVRVSGRVQLVLAALLVALLLAAVIASLPHAAPGQPAAVRAARLARDRARRGAAGVELRGLGGDHPPGRRLPPPARDLPRAATIAVAVVGVLYLGVAAASILVLGAAAGSTDAPLAELLARASAARSACWPPRPRCC